MTIEEAFKHYREHGFPHDRLSPHADGRPLTPGDIPVRTDVFIHNLHAFTLEALRRAVAQGLTPSGLDFTGMTTLP